MDLVNRGWRPLLIAAIGGALVVACFEHAPDGRWPVGTSDKPAGGRFNGDAGAAAASAMPGASALPPNYKATFTKLNKDRMISQGHATGRWEVDVYANDVAAKALAARAHAVPVGAIVVEEHYERSADKPRGPIMVMEKRPAGFAKDHGDWRWLVIGSQGQLVKDGTIDSCAGCHDDSPMDGLFPLAP